MASINTPPVFFVAVVFAGEIHGHEKERRNSLRVILALTLVLVLPTGAQAEIVAFTDGRVLKVEDAYLEGDTIIIELRGGGAMRVPATRVDRVIADEVDDDPQPIPDDAGCPWRWDGESLPEGVPYRALIDAAARGADIQPWLLVAVVRAESGFDPRAVSRAGAAGLTQLMPATASDRAVVDVFDPADNLRAGAEHLRALLDRFGSLTLALAAYNAGPATVERYDGVPPYRETRDYVRKVTRWFCGEASER
jgi:hypothetical protein